MCKLAQTGGASRSRSRRRSYKHSVLGTACRQTQGDLWCSSIMQGQLHAGCGLMRWRSILFSFPGTCATKLLRGVAYTGIIPVVVEQVMLCVTNFQTAGLHQCSAAEIGHMHDGNSKPQPVVSPLSSFCRRMQRTALAPADELLADIGHRAER